MTGIESVNTSQLSHEERLEGFGYAVSRLSELNPQGADSRYGKIGEAIAETLATMRGQDVFGDFLDWRSRRKSEPFPYLGEVAVRAVHMLIHPYKEELGWPDRFTDIRPCREFLSACINPNGQLFDNFSTRLHIAQIQSNIPSRAIFPALVAEIYKDRIGSGRIADVGAGMNHTLNALFMPRNILRGIKVKPAEGSGKKEYDEQLRSILGDIAISRPVLEFGTGFEREDMLDSESKTWDPMARLWVKISSIRPDEIVRNPEVEKIYDEADNFESGRVEFKRADFTGRPHEILRIANGGEYDLINLSFVLHQYMAEPHNVRAIVRNSILLGSKWAVLGILDFVEVAEDRNSLRFKYERNEYSVRGLIYDLMRPDDGCLELVRFKTGRCPVVQIGKDWGRITENRIKMAS